MKQIVSYIRKRLPAIVLYIALIVIVLLMGWLYEIPSEGLGYTLLLLAVTAILAGIPDAARYMRRLRQLQDSKAQLQADFPELPPPEDLAEACYQEMLTLLYQQKMELESGTAIRRKEMLDYYSMWAHQIKTPLSAMHLLLQSLKKEQMESMEQIDPEAYERFLFFDRGLSVELFKTEQYVEMVLSYLRMEEMGNDLLLKSYAVEPLVRQAVRKYSQMFIAKGICPVVGELSGEVLTDEKWISFVIEQILSNAVKYTEQGTVFLGMEGTTLVIRDTGIGIRKEDLPRIFEKGFTGYNGRTDKKSTGIGLYLCRQVLEKLGHTIRIESAPGKGTEVRIAFGRTKVDFRD